MRNSLQFWLIFSFILISILMGTYFATRPYLSALSTISNSNTDTVEQIIQDLKELNESDSNDNGPFNVHEEFHLSLFSNQAKSPQALIQDADGFILVSEPDNSRVGILDPEGNYAVLVSNLTRPHGIALSGDKLYIAETGQIIQYDYRNQEASNPTVLLDLPADGLQWKRGLGIGPNNRLYISVGSSCATCIDDDWRRSSLLEYDLQSERLITYATGIKNTIYFAWDTSGQFYGTDLDVNGQSELNRLTKDINYGFPFCSGKNIPHAEYDDASKCRDTEESIYDFNENQLPYDIDFLNEDAIIAVQGGASSILRLSKESNYQEQEVLMSGFIQENSDSIGRPTGVLVTADGSLLIADEQEGLIYRLTPKQS